PGEHVSTSGRAAAPTRQDRAEPDVAGTETDTDEGGIHAPGGCGDTHIRCQGQGKTAAAGGTVEQTNDRLRAAAHGDDDIAVAAGRCQPLRHRQRCGLRSVFREIESGTESPTRAAHDHDPDILAHVQAGEEASQLVDQFEVQRIQGLRSVQRDPEYRTPLVQFETVVCHICNLHALSAAQVVRLALSAALRSSISWRVRRQSSSVKLVSLAKLPPVAGYSPPSI